ncbi:hypothetical protein IAT38_000932 [Cryptococcus sp. DSM 104549]
MPDTSTPTGLLADPLVAFGNSITLHILSYLTLPDILACTLISQSWHHFIEYRHSTSIYRRLAWDVGVLPGDMDALIRLENGRPGKERELDPPERPGPERESPVDWKATVKSERVVLQNWKKGRAEVKWISPALNEIWDIKVDREQGVIYSSSESDTDGVLAWDIETTNPLFLYDCPSAAGALLEFARGHLIIRLRPSGAASDVIEVHLTPPALLRLTSDQRGQIPDPCKSVTYQTGRTLPSGAVYRQLSPGSKDVPPRGHLTYSKTIRPPTEYFMLRARVYHENEEGERAVLATVGRDAIYIWGLDDDECETCDIPSVAQVEPSCVEFDDDYIFLGGGTDEKLHVISRVTNEHLLTFPASHSFPNLPEPRAIFVLPDEYADKNDSSNRIYSGRVSQHAMRGGMEGGDEWAELRRGAKAVLHLSGGIPACHYTSNDLVYTDWRRLAYILRDYKMVLAIPDKTRRFRAASERLLLLSFDFGVMKLCTYRESLAFKTPHDMYLLHTSDLPDAPFQSSPGEPGHTIRVLKLSDSYDDLSSCLEMDRERLYTDYIVFADQDVVAGTESDKFRPMPESGGVYIKAWEFDTISPEEWHLDGY